MKRPFPAYQGDEPYVFVSYAHADDGIVYPEITWLHDQGFNIWYDEGITPGSEWRDELGERIAQSSLFLYFITPTSVGSEHCVREVNYAMDQQIPLLVVYLEETDLPPGLGMSLSSTQALMRHELTDLDYRIKLINGASDHIRRGIGVAASTPRVLQGVSKTLTATLVGLAAVLSAIVAVGVMVVQDTWTSESVTQRSDRPLRKYTIVPDYQQNHLFWPIRISGNGRYVFAWDAIDGQFGLYRRDLSLGAETLVVDLTELQGEPAHWWSASPDGEWVLYRRNDGWYKARSVGGSPIRLADAGIGTSAVWGPQDLIVFSGFGDASTGLTALPAAGGTPRTLTEAQEGWFHGVGPFTPDGRGIVYGVSEQLAVDRTATTRFMLLSLDTGESVNLLDEGSTAMLTPSGHLVVQRQDGLWAAAFDADEQRLISDLVPVLDGVYGATPWKPYGLSADGTLVYMAGERGDDNRLVWVDRQGGEETLELPPDAYDANFSRAVISPDGRRIAVPISTGTQRSDIWIYTIASGTLMRLIENGYFPVWTADGSAIEYTAGVNGFRFTRPANGAGVARQMISGGRWQHAFDPVLLFDCAPGWADCDIGIRSPDGEGSLFWVLKTEHNELQPVLSPDGRWMAHVSNESGRRNVYIRPYPDVEAGKWQVSTDGGDTPRWSPDGSELYFKNFASNHLTAVQVTDRGDAVEVGEPIALFDTQTYHANFDISPDGQRFLFIKRGEGADVSVVVVENFFDELNRLTPHPD